MWFKAPTPKQRRLITDVLPDRVNEVIEDLEERGFLILSVLPHVFQMDGLVMQTYDLFVEGEGDPLWGIGRINGC